MQVLVGKNHDCSLTPSHDFFSDSSDKCGLPKG